jgi:hypothetical protein
MPTNANTPAEREHHSTLIRDWNVRQCGAVGSISEEPALSMVKAGEESTLTIEDVRQVPPQRWGTVPQTAWHGITSHNMSFYFLVLHSVARNITIT